MSDYRNLPFKFGYGGLNLVAAPENLEPGQFSHFQNVRYRRLGTLEARPGTEYFTPFFEQPPIGDVFNSYPVLWNIGNVTKTHFIGKVFHLVNAVDTETDGYLIIHSAGAESGNATEYRTFINGTPVAKMESGCTTYPALQPNGFSVVRATSKSGIPITLIDGSHFVINKECNHDSPGVFLPSYVYGIYAGNVPAFFAYKLGITPPTTMPTVNVVAAGSGLTGSYVFAYSYYSSKTGFESALSPSTATIAGFDADTAAFTAVNISTDPQVNTIRFWRKGGTLASSWRLVGTAVNNPCAAGTTTFNDTNTDATIAVAEAFDTDTIAPFSTIDQNGTTLTGQHFNYSWGPFNGKYNFWVGDPVKKGYIYWNKSGDLSRYNPLTSVTAVSDPGEELQNGFLFSSVPFVFSKLNLYGMDFGGPDALPEFSPRLIPIGMGLAGKWAFAVGPNTVYFLGRDGIYATDCQPGRPISLTESTIKPIFQGTTVNGVPPIDWALADTARMAVTPKELHFFYQGVSDTLTWIHLVYDLERNAWSTWSPDYYANAYADEGAPSNRIIFGVNKTVIIDKNPYSFDDSRPLLGIEVIQAHVRGGAVDNEIPLTFKEYGSIQIDTNLAGVPLTITPYYNSEVLAGTPLTLTPDVGDVRKDYSLSLGDFYARSLSLDLQWEESPGIHPILYQGNLLFREDEEQLIHWEQPPSALGNGGWFHLKDGWIMLRSTSDVTLTVVIDGTYTDTYNILSTGGERKRRYVEFKPRRGTSYQFKLDSILQPLGVLPKPFRFYGEESILNGKPWITGASYAPISPFGNVGYAQYRRTEGGT